MCSATSIRVFAFVMATAIPVTALGYALAARRHSPICAPGFSLPTRREIDRPLVLGAVLFGIGWGLVGYCPGPALASLGLGNPATVLFVFAMLVGMGGHTALPSLLSVARSTPEPSNWLGWGYCSRR